MREFFSSGIQEQTLELNGADFIQSPPAIRKSGKQSENKRSELRCLDVNANQGPVSRRFRKVVAPGNYKSCFSHT